MALKPHPIPVKTSSRKNFLFLVPQENTWKDDLSQTLIGTICYCNEQMNMTAKIICIDWMEITENRKKIQPAFREGRSPKSHFTHSIPPLVLVDATLIKDYF